MNDILFYNIYSELYTVLIGLLHIRVTAHGWVFLTKVLP